MEPANCKCSNKGRNLVVCIDGTSNQFGTKVRVVPTSSLSIFDLIFVTFIEHKCGWTVQQDWENGGFEPTHLLQQRHWHIRKTFLEISQVSDASRWQQRRSRYCLVRIPIILSWALADKPAAGILKRSSSVPIVGSLINTKRMIEFFYSVSLDLTQVFVFPIR